ncbi:MAG: long-chain fatty acid--CoA ligase [Desulfovibrionaceae bacterium]|nr:long-chain fatty acid--CoA ligase [Desulfovibrionaceae bacterium]
MEATSQRPWLSNYPPAVPSDVEHFSQPLFALLDEAAQHYPDRKALIFQNTSYTYRQLQEKAEQCAAALRGLGIQEGDKVGVLLPNLPQTAVAFWGILKAGAIAVMTNPLYQEKELVHHFNDAQVKCLILLDLLWPRVASLRSRLPIETYIVTSVGEALSFPLNYLYSLKMWRQKSSHTLPSNDPHVLAWRTISKERRRYSATIADPAHQPALLQYTGGTTGLPKGVMLSHANLGTNATQILSIIQETAQKEHRFIALLPFFHVYGLATGLVIPAALAATTLPLPRYVPQDMLQLIAKHRPTIFPGAPSVYTSLLQQKTLPQYDLKSIQICISGSAPLAHETYRQFQKLTGAAILEGYGLTEASPITHINYAGEIGSIGVPLPSTQARLIDTETGEDVTASGQKGELIIRGPQVMQGYWNHAEETAQTLRDGWLYTGDIATMDEKGFFTIIDRKKDLVLVGGYNVYPREIDEVLLEHPKILEAVAVGIDDAVRGEILKAYIVPKKGESLTKAEVTAWCREKLASYKVPRHVEFRQELPKTMVGKVLRRALREEELAKHASKNKHVA